MTPRTTAALLAAALMTTAACSGASDDDLAAAPPTARGHGAVTGAAEVAEPQLHLVSVDAEGGVSMIDLLTDETTVLPAVDAPDTVTSDGRYVFSTGPTGVDVVDSGVWTWDHTDHFHYYRSEPRTVGRVEGAGAASICCRPPTAPGCSSRSPARRCCSTTPP
jgi:hypothetical protein